MKRNTLFAAAILLFSAPFAAFGYTVDLEYGWQADDLQVRQAEGYDYVGVEGCVFPTATLGKLYELRLLPKGARVESYEVVGEEWQEIEGSFRIGTIRDGAVEVMMAEDHGGVEYIGSGDLFGYPVMVSSVEPVRVVDGRVSLLRRLDVRVECSTGGSELRPARRSANMDRHLRDLMGRVLGEEPMDYPDWQVQGYRDWVSEAPSLEGGVVDCVIVTADSMAAEFQRLAAWHDRMGIKTVVRTMDWIEGKYPGSDRAERVRNFLRDAYGNWGTVYLLVGGAPPVVPIRYGWTNHYGGAFIPTDVYFGELEGTWNADGDRIFAEFGNSPEDPGDGVQFYTQLMTGRAPVRTVDEARIFVDKTISYAAEPEPGFAETALFLGEVIFPVDWESGDPITLDGGVICDSAAAYFPADFDTVKLYQKRGEMTRTTCLQGFDHGYDYTVIAGHGDAFRTSAADGSPPFINGADFDTLTNDKRFGFVYALNCNNSAVDVDCVFRHLLLNPDGGCILTYATTRYDFPNVGQYFLNEFLHYLFQRGVTRVGDVCTLHHIKFIPSGLIHDGAVRWSLLTYILLGDPAMDFWVAEPETLTVLDVGSMTLSDSVYSVEVLDGGVGVSGARVVMMGDRGEYGFGITGSDGIAEVGYRPLGLGYAELSVSADGYLMYGDSVEVGGAGGRLYVSSVSVDDGVGWAGNDDGEAGWGERLGLGVGLCNGGAGSVTGVGCDIRAVAGCSLYVRVEFDDAVSDSVIHIGGGGYHPGGLEFGLGVGDRVFGRSPGVLGDESGGWFWLDASGWHVRFIGDGSSHSYSCSLSVYGELVGYVGYELEEGDELGGGGGELWFGGELGASDFIDGLDLAMGSGWDVTVHEGHADYGSVGGSEVLGWYDVEFLGGGGGDGLGVWFEASMDGDGGSWQDWFRVDVVDGEVKGERLVFEGLGGDTTGVYYGIRNTGGGGLRGVEGLVRGLSGVEVCDSVAAYGDVCGGCYSEGGQYRVRETGGAVSYEVIWRDYYGREWSDTVEVREVVAPTGLGYRLVLEDLELYWEPSESSGLSGYDVYRGDTYGGEYELVGTVEGYSRLEESGLASEESYYYYVCARDSMGNMSAPSETLEAWTGPPYLPGWPAGTADAMPSPATLADVDGDGDLEIIVGAKDQHVYMWHHDGTRASGWPRPTTGEVWSGAAVANFDSDPSLEILIGCDDGYLYAWNADGSPLMGVANGQFRKPTGIIRGAPTIDDLDGDLDLEVVVANSYGQVYAWNHDRTGFLQANGFFGQAVGSVSGSPTIADFDGVEGLEVIVGTSQGRIYVWHADGTGYLQPDGLFASPGAIYGTIAVGDIDNNGDMELVCTCLYGRSIRVYDHTGAPHAGWPRSLDGDLYSSPALTELDHDGKLDIVAAGYRGSQDESTSVYVFSDQGVLRSGWPITLAEDFLGSPIVGDVSGDGEPDIIIAGNAGDIHAWNADGTPVLGWPRHVRYEVDTTPALADLDGDNDVELVVPCYDAEVHTFDLGVPYNSESMHWPKLNHDTFNSGLYQGPSGAGVRPGGEPGIPARVMLSGYPNPARAEVNIRLGVPSNASGAKMSVEVFDVQGRRVKQVYSGNPDPGFHELHWDGTNTSGQRVSSGIYFLQVDSAGGKTGSKVVLVR
jgi:hypothetical protein